MCGPSRADPNPTRPTCFLLAATEAAARELDAETFSNASVSDGSISDDTASDGGSSIGSGVEAGTGDTPFPPAQPPPLPLPSSARAFQSVGSGRR